MRNITKTPTQRAAQRARNKYKPGALQAIPPALSKNAVRRMEYTTFTKDGNPRFDVGRFLDRSKY